MSMIFIDICLGLALYLLPSFVAAYREHQNAGAIAVLNILLGWTVLGWVGALVWASTAVWTFQAASSILDREVVSPVVSPKDHQVDDFLANYSRDFPNN